MPRIWMIHEVGPWIADVPFAEDDILTFDDGLYSQYHYRHLYPEINRKIFFVSPYIMARGGKQVLDIAAPEAHRRAFEYMDTSAFMTQAQVLELAKIGEIGGHGYAHLDPHKSSFKRDVELKVSCLTDDTLRMFMAFKDMGIEITKFCFPYNDDDTFLKIILQPYKFELFGPGRVDVNDWH